MSAFKHFDPYAFLANDGISEQPSAPGCALAPLAALAPSTPSTVNAASAPPSLAGVAALAGRPQRYKLPYKRPTTAAQDALIAKAANPANRDRHTEAGHAQIGFTEQLQHLWADGIARLDPERPPGDVPPRRWRQFMYDAARFLDSGFAKQAAALGWDTFDLFGCDSNRPFARIDNAGLIWMLDGDRLVALTEQSARIETRSGSTLTYRRKPGDLGRVLAWEFGP